MPPSPARTDRSAQPSWLWRNPEPKTSYDVVVVGAGGHGLATAEYLAEWLLDAAAEYRGVAPRDLRSGTEVAAIGAPT